MYFLVFFEKRSRCLLNSTDRLINDNFLDVLELIINLDLRLFINER